jgi:hypothetical protein
MTGAEAIGSNNSSSSFGSFGYLTNQIQNENDNLAYASAPTKKTGNGQTGSAFLAYNKGTPPGFTPTASFSVAPAGCTDIAKA